METDRGKVTVKTTWLSLNSEYALLHTQAKPRNWHLLLGVVPDVRVGPKGTALPRWWMHETAAPSTGSPPAGPREQGLTGCSSPATPLLVLSVLPDSFTHSLVLQ